MIDYKLAKSYLNLIQEEKVEEINIIDDYIDLHEKSKGGMIININDFSMFFNLLEKHNYLRFVNSIITKENLIEFFNAVYKKNTLKLKSVMKEVEKVNIENYKFMDSQSLIIFLLHMHKVLEKVGSLKIIGNKIVEKKTKEENKKLAEMIQLHMTCIFRNINDLSFKLKAKLNNDLDKINELLDIINKLNIKEVIDDEYENLVKRYSKLIRNDNLFDNEDLQSLNIVLREKVKENKNKSKEKFQENINTKLGTREERKIRHQKEKELEEIESLKKELDSDSKIWIDLILEQIESDEEDFINHPSNYLPNYKENQYNLIMKTILKIAEYKDLDDMVKEVLKNC